jgi:hypothetical protein
MARSISRTEKRRGRGRPRKDPTSIHLTLLPDQLAALDAMIADEDQKTSRPEAIRIVLVDHLRRRGYLLKK